MANKQLNTIECLNEGAVYTTSLFMLIFTDWIPDVEMRYTLGYVYMPLILGIVVVNLAIVIIEMVYSIKVKYQTAKRER